MAEKRHPGITMHKLTVGPGFVGLLFTVGCSLIFVLGFPTLWYFVAFSAAFGIAVALLLRLSSGRQAQRMKPLSILSADHAEHPSRPDRGLQAQDSQPHERPRLCSA